MQLFYELLTVKKKKSVNIKKCKGVYVAPGRQFGDAWETFTKRTKIKRNQIHF